MFDWIITLVQDGGYAGIFLLMTVEHVFPPIPSELIMPLAGYSAARGALSLPLIILSGSLGSLLGTTLWFIAGYALGSRYAAVGDWVNPLSSVIVVGIVLLYLYRVLTYDGSSTVDDSERARDE